MLGMSLDRKLGAQETTGIATKLSDGRTNKRLFVSECDFCIKEEASCSDTTIHHITYPQTILQRYCEISN